jgi:RHS repeat-associated protein
VYDALERVSTQTETVGGDLLRTTYAYRELSNSESAETTNGITKTFSYDAFDERVGMQSNGRSFTFSRNLHGDISALIEGTGATATYGYTPYGRPDPALTSHEPGAPTNPFRFNDRRFDAASNTVDMGFRRFGPDVGRFLEHDFYQDALGDVDLSVDPLTQNRYAFAGGNPIGFVEVDGHYPDLGPGRLFTVVDTASRILIPSYRVSRPFGGKSWKAWQKEVHRNLRRQYPSSQWIIRVNRAIRNYEGETMKLANRRNPLRPDFQVIHRQTGRIELIVEAKTGSAEYLYGPKSRGQRALIAYRQLVGQLNYPRRGWTPPEVRAAYRLRPTIPRLGLTGRILGPASVILGAWLMDKEMKDYERWRKQIAWLYRNDRPFFYRDVCSQYRDHFIECQLIA